jgi:hypothetical protein
MVDRDAGGDQRAHHLHMAAFGRRDQCRAAIAVGAAQVGAVRQGHAQDGQAPLRAGQQVGAVALGILGVHIGAGCDQGLGDGHAVQCRGQQQRRAPLRIAGFQGFAQAGAFRRGEQGLHRGQVLGLDGRVQGAGLRWCGGQQCRRGGAGHGGGVEKRVGHHGSRGKVAEGCQSRQCPQNREIK